MTARAVLSVYAEWDAEPLARMSGRGEHAGLDSDHQPHVLAALAMVREQIASMEWDNGPEEPTRVGVELLVEVNVPDDPMPLVGVGIPAGSSDSIGVAFGQSIATLLAGRPELAAM